MAAGEKRLARLVTKMLAHPQAIQPQGEGGFVGEINHKPALRLSKKMAEYAVSRGILECGEGGRLVATDVAHHWAKRVLTCSNSHTERDNAFAAQHWQLEEREIFAPDGDLVMVRANIENSPLLRLYRQKDSKGARFLSNCEFAAGEKFRQDYASSTMGKMSSSNWEAVRQGKSAARAAKCADGLYLSAIDGRKRVMDALSAVGPILDKILFCLLIREQTLGTLEQDHHWPKRSGKIVLKIALSRLANFYQLI